MAPRSRQVQKKKAAALMILALAAAFDLQKEKKKRKVWAKNWLKRKQLGCYENLMRELALEDKDSYRRCLRMDTDAFAYLLQKVSHRIQKQNTRLREAIPAEERLALTLRFLATGETQSSLSFQFRIAQSTISGILCTVCKALYEEMVDEVMKVPSTETEWKTISSCFESMWNFPLCIGALDGKHVKISPPVRSGSHYYNYKGTFSIILMALVDANLKFLFVDVGTNGRCSDGGVWAKSDLKKALELNTLQIPEADYLPGTNTKVPYVIVADDAFPLTTTIMKPYQGRNLSNRQTIYNYRVSRARRVVENAFGILANRFRIFKSDILATPLKARTYVLASCILHNFLRSRSLTEFANSSEDSDIIHNLRPLGRASNTNGTHHAKQVQAWFCEYFNTTGAVPWQYEMALLH